jgi:hypothetical protein
LQTDQSRTYSSSLRTSGFEKKTILFAIAVLRRNQNGRICHKDLLQGLELGINLDQTLDALANYG